MRIGILTYHCVPNFGAQLQALSTVGYLKRQGHEPIVLNWYADDLEEMYSKRIPEEQIVVHQQFTEAVFPLSRRCSHEVELANEIDSLDLDGIVVGSDALFKYIPIKNRRNFSKRKIRWVCRQVISCELLDGNPFWGGFLKMLKKRIPASVYAVSSQNCPYYLMKRSEKQLMARTLSNYSIISVRDQWTKRMIEDVIRKSVVIYPDPVFSFNYNCCLTIPSKDEIISKFHLQEKYVLISFSDKFVDAEYLGTLANKLKNIGLQPVALPMPERLFSSGQEMQINLPLSPIEWYSLIVHSHGYIGERMHPIVVCLHNCIPFFSFDEYGVNHKGFSFINKLKYDPFSSKTYLIVSEAQLLDNLYSYKQYKPWPSADDVVGKLINFDIEKCKCFAKNMHNEYERGMLNVLKSFC